MFCVARRTAAPRPRMDTWTRNSAMAGSFVRADKTSQDVPRWVHVDQTLLTAAILNLAVNARNATPNWGTYETRHLGNTREGVHRRCASFATQPNGLVGWAVHDASAA